MHCEVRLTVEVTLFFDLSSLVNVHSRGQKIVFSHEIDIIAECKTQVKNTKIFEKLGLMAEQWCWPSRPPWHGLATILSLHAFLKLLSWWCGRPRICKNHWGHKKVYQQFSPAVVNMEDKQGSVSSRPRRLHSMQPHKRKCPNNMTKWGCWWWGWNQNESVMMWSRSYIPQK